VLSWLVKANGDTKQQDTLSGMFAKELSKNGAAEITTNQEYCSSNNRPLHINQEMTETLARALQYSEHIKVKSDCQKVATEKEYQFCRFYFYSPNKAEQWSAGFTFLGNPYDGTINVDSIQCFSTP
jgi:bisphosphoglycerate-dependent phosphoglycerate mutase